MIVNALLYFDFRLAHGSRGGLGKETMGRIGSEEDRKVLVV